MAGLAAIVVGSLAAIIGASNSLGYLLPAIIGLESMGVPSPGETALVRPRCWPARASSRSGS